MTKNNTLTIGTHVYKRVPYAGIIAEYIVESIETKEQNTIIKLKGVTIIGHIHSLANEVFLSYEEAAAFYEAQSEKCIQSYINKLTGSTTEETLHNMIVFAYEHNVACAEEYTDYEAREAFRRLAESLNIPLEES